MLVDDSSLSGDLRDQVWSIITLAQANQIFVHSRRLEVRYTVPGKKRVRKKQVPELLTIAVLNALVPNSAILLVGGHGGAKTTLAKVLGRMFTGMSLDSIEQSILRGHPQLTEEKILATLDLPLLMKGEERVKWRSFVTSFWKVIDEINRMTPYAQNILLSMLAERRVKFYDATTEIPQYCLYATMNPRDAGSFDLPLPFLDRFGISLPFTMPTTTDLSIILKAQDTKLYGYDEFVQVPGILTVDDMLRIWKVVDRQPVLPEAEHFIHAIIREFSLCDRINKGTMSDRRVGTDLCNGCHFDTTASVCNKVVSILSVRCAKDLQRYARALAWLMDVPVDVHLVATIAPYVIAHRVVYVSTYLNEPPFYGDKMEFTRHLVDLVKKRFSHREFILEIIDNFRAGEGNEQDFQTIKNYARNDLVTRHDLLPAAEGLMAPEYKDLLVRIQDAYGKGDVEALVRLKEELLVDPEIAGKSDLLARINIFLEKLTLTSYTFPFSKWRDQVWADLSAEFGYLDGELRKSLTRRVQKQLRTRDSIIGLIVTGNNDDSDVSLDVSGGVDAIKIKEILAGAGIFDDSGDHVMRD